MCSWQALFRAQHVNSLLMPVTKMQQEAAAAAAAAAAELGCVKSTVEPRTVDSPARFHCQLVPVGAAVVTVGAVVAFPTWVQVQASKLLLWGTSFAGGHVLTIAAEMGSNITAVVAQVASGW